MTKILIVDINDPNPKWVGSHGREKAQKVSKYGYVQVKAKRNGKGSGFYYPSQASAEEDGHTQANISKVINGVRFHHNNLIWERA